MNAQACLSYFSVKVYLQVNLFFEQILKKPILTEIFNFFKIDVKLRLVVRKRSPNINSDVILQYISVTIFKSAKLSRILPYSKKIKKY